MSDAEISILLTARDNASAVMANVKKNAGELQGALGTALKVAAIAAGAGILALGGALASCVGDAMESQKVIAQTNAVLMSTRGASGMTADSVGALADQLSRVT